MSGARRRPSLLAVLAGGVFLAVGIYAGAYWLIARDGPLPPHSGGPEAPAPKSAVQYSRDGQWDALLRKLFRPAHLVDRRLRPGKWGLHYTEIVRSADPPPPPPPTVPTSSRGGPSDK